MMRAMSFDTSQTLVRKAAMSTFDPSGNVGLCQPTVAKKCAKNELIDARKLKSPPDRSRYWSKLHACAINLGI
jgi:hypothetical protein